MAFIYSTTGRICALVRLDDNYHIISGRYISNVLTPIPPEAYVNGGSCKAFSIPFPDMPEYTSYRLVA